MQTTLNNRRTINAWALFDWANSAFALVIAVAIFPAYFTQVTDDEVRVLGIHMSNSSLYAYAISAAYLVITLLSPLLSGIADYGGKRKTFLRFFTTIGALACISLYFFKGMGQLELGVIAFILGVIGFAGGLVFYNSYLPVIASEDQYDKVSARGFAFGYIGSVLLLLINLLVISKPTWFGLPEEGSIAVRLAFVMVGLWWLGFSIIPFRRLPADAEGRPQTKLITRGMEELRKVWRTVRHQRYIKAFLLSFFCYSAGVQTVLYLAATFAEKELQFDTGQLIGVILLLQIVAIGGAYLFARVSAWKGNKASLMVMLIIWTSICFCAYFVQTDMQFYIIAASVGTVMGGIQSLSRSTYSKLLPEKTPDTTSYFSFYDVLEKTAIIIGTFSFGFIEQLTGSMRLSVLLLGVFFVAGLLALIRVKVQPAVGEGGREGGRERERVSE
ncbi:MAG: MFS transporter [Saprospiraceae bacterium]|nr:MFS transporter [Saprospiraceae bacterium]